MVLRESAVLSFEVLEQLAFVLNQDRFVALLQCSHGQEDLLGPFDQCMKKQGALRLSLSISRYTSHTPPPQQWRVSFLTWSTKEAGGKH